MKNNTNAITKVAKTYDSNSAEMTVEPQVKLDFTNEPTKFNPYNAKLLTQEITSKKLESYYNQIKNNLYMMGLSYWYVARDLNDAKVKLNDTKFKQLVTDLHFSSSTVSRYIQIATSERSVTLFNDNNLPESWTTLLEIIKLGKKDYDKLIESEILDPTTTMKEIKKEISKGKKRIPKPVVNTILFATVSIDKSKIQTPILKKFEKVFEQFIDTHKDFLSFDFDKNVEKKITAFQKKLSDAKDNSKKKSVKKRKEKELN